MASVGEELKRERELRGISLEQIARDTKIGLRFLEAIDSGRLDVIPGDFYRRSYIRAYAAYLGMDADRMAVAYDFEVAGHRCAPPASSNASTAEARGRQVPAWFFLVLLGLGLGGVAAVWPRGPDPSSPADAPTPPSARQWEPGLTRRGGSAVPEDTRASPVLEREVTSEARADDNPALEILLKLVDTCWLEVRVDGEVVVQGLMLPGFQRTLRAREEIRLWLGNAGGVSLWLNGRPGKSLGRQGQVRKQIRITPANVAEFVVS